jgi:hypothetical protein
MAEKLLEQMHIQFLSNLTLTKTGCILYQHERIGQGSSAVWLSHACQEKKREKMSISRLEVG